MIKPRTVCSEKGLTESTLFFKSSVFFFDVDSEYSSMKVSVIWFICPQILFIFAMKISQIQVTSSYDRSVSFCDHPMKLTLILQLTNQNTP